MVQRFKIKVTLDVRGDWQSEPLEFLSEITKCTTGLVDSNVRIAVGRARDQGQSWERIGSALGVSRQAAWERFAR